ncbi:MAG TPA: F0F1 ATP synthase subunit epsilon [Chthoniobacterales bacterium]|nr:F0F1 ATP synthase subunit epsilon [Chthoniobacterales bacterium]
MATLKLEIVTPEAKIYSEDVSSVLVPGAEGELGVLPEHMPLLTQLAAGELRIVKDGQESVLAVGEGFVEITPTTVSVLTDMAVAESDIDETAAEAAIKRAQEALKDDKISDEDMASAQAVMMKSLAQLKVKRRKKV